MQLILSLYNYFIKYSIERGTIEIVFEGYKEHHNQRFPRIRGLPKNEQNTT